MQVSSISNVIVHVPFICCKILEVHNTSANMDEDSPPISRLMNAVRRLGVGPKPGPSMQLPGNNPQFHLP